MPNSYSLNKIIQGFIFSDEFNNEMNPLWDILPNDSNRVALTSNSIKLLPGENLAEFIIPCPNEKEFVFQTHLKYEPTTDIVEGGCIMKSITENYVECELTYENEQTYYKYLKLIYSNYIVNLRASKDGLIWEDFGNTKFLDTNYIGYYLKDNVNELEIHNCNIYKNNLITLTGVNENHTIEILNSSGNELIESINIKKVNDKYIIDFIDELFPLDITVVIKSGATEIARKPISNVYGGDVYSLESNIVFEVKDLGTGLENYNLGLIREDEKLFELYVTNTSDVQIDGKLKVVATSDYDKGSNMAYISPLADIADVENLKELDVSIQAGATNKFFIKIVKDYNYITIDDNFSFNIIFT